MNEARRFPGLEGEVLKAADEARKKKLKRLAQEAVEDSMQLSESQIIQRRAMHEECTDED